jgi:DNA polymerase III delta subunit
VTVPATPTPPLAYFWGEDAFGVEHAARAWAGALEAEAGAPLDRWRVSAGEEADAPSGDSTARRRTRLLDEIEQRLATSPLFGGGCAVIVRQPGALLREGAARARTLALPRLLAPGNGLCFVELTAAGASGAAASGALAEAIQQAGGRVEQLPALTRERMEGWLERRAQELGTRLGPGTARLLAERVGAYVREGDVDRRRQSELANAELEKLALYRPDGTITRDDVEALVGEAVPGSTWAFLDAIGYRRAAEAVRLAERLLDGGTALPLLVAQLHRRLRELIVIRDHLAAGTKPPELARALKLQPFRAQKLAEQAQTWEPAALDGALTGLFELDLLSKGIAADGGPHSLSDGATRLYLIVWIGERVRRVAGEPAGRKPAAVGPGRSLGA